MSRNHQLGDLQFAIMRILWQNEEATVAEVHQALFLERGLAPTTIATMLKKMEKKGVVSYRSEGRQFVYSATVEEKDVHRSMVGDLVNRLFDGSTSALVSHLLEEKEIDVKELSDLTRKIKATRKKKEGKK